jgi:release factor glutamine methyltransferase
VSPTTSTPAGPGVAIAARLRAAGCVFAEDEADLLLSAGASPADLLSMLERRVAGVPLEHILGWARFCAIRVTVAPGVFVPRARSELLVRQAVALLGATGTTVLDLCCGSGAVGAAVAASAPRVRLYAADIDAPSVECARRNLEPFGAQVYLGDLFAPLPPHLRRRVDVLIANVPYVPTAAMGLLPPEARLHEPRRALHGGADGLDVLRRVAAGAPDWLARPGHLVVETSHRQAPLAAEVLSGAGLIPRVVHDEDLDATVVIGERRR